MSQRKSLEKKCDTARSMKKKAWDWYSKYIRLKYANDQGDVQCVTCGQFHFWKGGQMHCGHYVDSRNNSVLLHEKITYPQCRHCNITLRGNKNKYTFYLLERGCSINDLKFFEGLKHQICKKSRLEWQYEANKYKQLAIEEAKKRGLEI